MTNSSQELHQILLELKQIRTLQDQLRACVPESLEGQRLTRLIQSQINTLKENPDFQETLVSQGFELTRLYVINALIKLISAEHYLEIGVSGGDVFTQVKVACRTGVDPIAPSEKVRAILSEPTVRYCQMTSDAFFNDDRLVAPEQKWDVIFVDGLHTYEQAYRDVIHGLNHLSENGFIIMHDCNPVTESMAMPARSSDEAFSLAKLKGIPYTGAWCGDVWKAMVRLRSEHDDVHAMVLDSDYGLGVMTRAKSENRLHFSHDQIKQLTFEDLAAQRKHFLNLKPPTYFFQYLRQNRNAALLSREPAAEPIH